MKSKSILTVIAICKILPVIVYAGTWSIEYGDFANPKRVGVDSFVLGQDNLVIGVDLKIDGTPIPTGPEKVAEIAQKIKEDLAPVFGLKNILSAGLILLDRLSPEEKIKIMSQAQGIEQKKGK